MPSPPAARPAREPDTAAEERNLAEGLCAGEHGAVARFLARTHHPVFCLACRLTHDPDLRRDWTHSVLLGVLEDLRQGRFTWRHPGSFWSWFRKRAYFRLLDEHRRRRLRVARESTDESLQALVEIAGGDDPAAEAERAELRAALEVCLESLPNPEHRRALALFLLEDAAYAEVAECLRAPLNTVKTWIHRGRVLVRRCLAERLGLHLEPDDVATG
jgi:RNA polymerase sigma-70 factor (ECF subfamily)